MMKQQNIKLLLVLLLSMTNMVAFAYEVNGINWNHGVGSPDHFQESDISMLYYLSHSHFT